MEYFCYISRSKVDQLFNNYFPNQQNEWNEVKTTSNEVNASAGIDWSIAKIINLFKSGITYGRKGVIQREGKVKLQYTQKLEKVLIEIAKEKPIISLEDALKNSTEGLFVSYQGKFKIEKPFSAADSNQIISVYSEVDKKVLKLDCSLRFFSEGNEPDNKFAVHSGNRRFFSGEINLSLTTVLIILGINNNVIFGTPLFLILKPTSDFNYL